VKIILVHGFSDSGKTTTIEELCRLLVARGSRIGVLKHTTAPEFTIDTPGKDTWRAAAAGARVIVSVADNELAIIRRGKTAQIPLDRIMKVFRTNRVDFLFVEGLYKRYEDTQVIRILCAKNRSDALALLKRHPNPICVTGSIAKGRHEPYIEGVPVIGDARDIAKRIIED
jgi:molybdopterin-guanine dinucleotide biosynthesis protein B